MSKHLTSRGKAFTMHLLSFCIPEEICRREKYLEGVYLDKTSLT